MEEFKPITTQEEFETRLTERLVQKERSVSKKYEGYTSPEDLVKIKEDYDSQISALNEKLGNAEKDFSKKYESYTSPDDLAKIKKDYDDKIAKYESDSVKTRIAMEMGIPAELKDRLKGSNEDELREDAKLLAGFSKRKTPLASTEPSDSKDDSKREEMRRMVKDLGI